MIQQKTSVSLLDYPLQEKTTLDVYYESLCPDSLRFLVNQLGPQYSTLSSFVNVRLIPFGKASVIFFHFTYINQPKFVLFENLGLLNITIVNLLDDSKF